MPAINEAIEVMKRARAMEKAAELNCDVVLHELAINGFHDDVLKIKNDEIAHWKMADKLVQILENNAR